MNEKGLTLVELLAVLIVLSLIALIITPTIINSIQEYRNRLYDVQIDGIKEATQNWLADQLDQSNSINIPIEGKGVSVTIGELQTGGYVDSNLKDQRTHKPFKTSSYVTITFSDNQYIYVFNE